MKRFVVCIVMLLTVTTAASAQDQVVKHILVFKDYHDFVRSPEVVIDAKEGSLRLAHSTLLADEIGATDFHQTEPLSERVQARKTFMLDSSDVSEAEVFFFGSAKKLSFNGEEIKGLETLKSTGFSRMKVPTDLIKSGANDLRLWGGGNLLVEPSRAPGRSFKSTDGGKTWSNQGMTAKSTQQGEYLIRFRLGRYAPKGWALSPVLDMWGPRIGVPARLNSWTRAPPAQPKDTSLKMFVRTGPTPAPDGKDWTTWQLFGEKHTFTSPEHRFAQVKFELETRRAQETPRLATGFSLTEDRTTEKVPDSKIAIKLWKTSPPYSSVPFVYQEPTPRLKFLREKYKLDEVIAAGKTEMEQFMLLRYWIRNQWHTAWGSHPAAWMPPWDSLIILECKDQPDCLTMCTHFGCVFTQCCQALGWNARHCILDHHCVSEVYSNQHDKWIMMDTGNSAQRADVGLHYERDGVPLSARELHLAYKNSKLDGITVHFTPARLVEKIAKMCRTAPKPPKEVRPDVIPLAELKKYPVCQMENFRRYAFPPRNNFMSSLYPGELYQGWSQYFYDGYYWVGDSPDDPSVSPEYSLHADPNIPNQADWKLGWTRVFLSRTAKADELRVDLASHTPNLARFEIRTEPKTETKPATAKAKKSAKIGPQWGMPTPASFVWKLQPGDNVLTVRSVNAWGKLGSEARVELSFSSK